MRRTSRELAPGVETHLWRVGMCRGGLLIGTACSTCKCVTPQLSEAGSARTQEGESKRTGGCSAEQRRA